MMHFERRAFAMQMRRYYAEEFERRAARDGQLDAQRRHHFTPSQEHAVHLERYQKAYAEKGMYGECQEFEENGADAKMKKEKENTCPAMHSSLFAVRCSLIPLSPLHPRRGDASLVLVPSSPRDGRELRASLASRSRALLLLSVL